ncbi:MAG: PAS domain S-box protein [Rhodocyclaceae bacterium]|nr:PAS domain S-box protein [Rhodocyclaceae bacterium]MBX3669820.1 PAS domain S-box protein [Rhodocyclaceae bacterium]
MLPPLAQARPSHAWLATAAPGLAVCAMLGAAYVLVPAWLPALAAVLALASVAYAYTRRSGTGVAEAPDGDQFRALVEAMNEGLARLDPNGRVAYANRGFCRMLGYEPQELTGLALADLIDPNCRAIWDEQQLRRRSGAHDAYEIDLCRKDGRVLSASISPCPLFDAQQRFCGSFAVVTDITQRRQTDEMLRWVARVTAPLTGKEFFRSLMRNLALAFDLRIAFIAECTDFPTTRVRTLAHWNGADFTPNFEFALEGSPCEKVVQDGQVFCVPDRVTELFAGARGLPVRGYLGVPIFDSTDEQVIGHVVFLSEGPLDESVMASPLFQIFVSRAGVELRRKRAEDILRASEEKYRLLVENQTDLVVKYDAEQRLLFVSPSFCELFERREAQLLGTRFRPATAAEDAGNFARAWNELALQPHRTSFEERVSTRLGWRSIAWSARALAGAGGALDSVVAAGRDVTERKHAEEQSRRHLQQLAHVGRVSALGEMATAIAHEINQPLTAIHTYARASQRLLAQQSEAPEDLRHALDRVAVQAERAGEIIRRLRRFLAREGVQAQAADINELAGEVLALVRQEARQYGIALVENLQPGLPSVQVDAIQIQQIIVNLVKNAMDATNACADCKRLLELGTSLEDGGGVRVSVRDHAGGVAAQDAEQIFEPFFTTKSTGMGIGLAISRSIAEAHGARLWLEQPAGPGALFHLSLPRAAHGASDAA